MGLDFYRNTHRSVYIANWPEEGLLKIGSSQNPRARVRGFKTLIPSIRLEWHSDLILFASSVEAATHRAFKERRKHGEFFEVGIQEAVTEILRQIEATQEMIEKTKELIARRDAFMSLSD